MQQEYMYKLIKQQISDLRPDIYSEESNKQQIKELCQVFLLRLQEGVETKKKTANDLLILISQAISLSSDFYLRNQLEIVRDELTKIQQRESQNSPSQKSEAHEITLSLVPTDKQYQQKINRNVSFTDKADVKPLPMTNTTANAATKQLQPNRYSQQLLLKQMQKSDSTDLHEIMKKQMHRQNNIVENLHLFQNNQNKNQDQNLQSKQATSQQNPDIVESKPPVDYQQTAGKQQNKSEILSEYDVQPASKQQTRLMEQQVTDANDLKNFYQQQNIQLQQKVDSLTTQLLDSAKQNETLKKEIEVIQRNYNEIFEKYQQAVSSNRAQQQSVVVSSKPDMQQGQPIVKDKLVENESKFQIVNKIEVKTEEKLQQQAGKQDQVSIGLIKNNNIDKTQNVQQSRLINIKQQLQTPSRIKIVHKQEDRKSSSPQNSVVQNRQQFKITTAAISPQKPLQNKQQLLRRPESQIRQPSITKSSIKLQIKQTDNQSEKNTQNIDTEKPQVQLTKNEEIKNLQHQEQQSLTIDILKEQQNTETKQSLQLLPMQTKTIRNQVPKANFDPFKSIHNELQLNKTQTIEQIQQLQQLETHQFVKQVSAYSKLQCSSRSAQTVISSALQQDSIRNITQQQQFKNYQITATQAYQAFMDEETSFMYLAQAFSLKSPIFTNDYINAFKTYLQILEVEQLNKYLLVVKSLDLGCNDTQIVKYAEHVWNLFDFANLVVVISGGQQ